MRPQKLFYKTFNEDKILVVVISDIHWGHRDCDTELVKKNLKWCLDNNAYVIDGGDLCETATRDSIGAGVFEQSEDVQKQMKNTIELYRPLADKGLLLGMLRGNHEFRLYKHSGFELTETIADALKTKYFGDGMMCLFRVKNQNYTMYVSHPYSGSTLSYTKITAALKMDNVYDADIYVAAHTHQLAHHTRQYYRLNMRNKTVEEGERHYILSGSYLNWGGYSQQKGYEPMRKGSPKIKLHGLERMIRISL